MDDETEVRVRPMIREKFSIEEMLKGTAAKPVTPPPPEPETLAEAEPPETADPLPRPGDEYQAHARAASRPLLTLHFLPADQTREGFAYADLRRLRLVPADDPGSGPELVLRFVEAEMTEVRISGRNLEDLYFGLGRHVIGWVRQLPPRWDYRPKGDRAAVITGIRITTLER